MNLNYCTISRVNEIDNVQILINSPKKPNKSDKIQEEVIRACCITQSTIHSKFTTADKQNLALERTKRSWRAMSDKKMCLTFSEKNDIKNERKLKDLVIDFSQELLRKTFHQLAVFRFAVMCL